MRLAQAGRTKKKGQEVTTALTAEDETTRAAHRDEIERMRLERQNMTRKIGTDIVEKASAPVQVERIIVDDLGSIRGGLSSPPKLLLHSHKQADRLAEAEQLRLAEALARAADSKEEIVLSGEVGNILQNIEAKVAADEARRAQLNTLLEDYGQRRQQRGTAREQQLALRAKREEERRKEAEEYANWQAERRRKLDEKQHAREIEARAAAGEVPTYRVCVLGPRCGKTALVRRFAQGEFVEAPDPAVDRVYNKPHTLRGSDCMITIVDTTSLDEFGDMRQARYRASDGFLVAFDLTRKPKVSNENLSLSLSFTLSLTLFVAAQRTFKYLRAFGDALKVAKGVTSLAELPLVLVGQREDLIDKRRVKAGDAVALAKEWGAKYVEVSAKTGENVVPAFETLVSLLVKPTAAQSTGSAGEPPSSGA